MSELLLLTFDSLPGVYEVETETTLTYEITIPFDYTQPGVLKISEYEDEVEPEESRGLILLGLDLMVGQQAQFIVFVPEGSKPVRGPKVTGIARIAD